MAKKILTTKEDFKEAVDELFDLVVAFNASSDRWFECEIDETVNLRNWLEFMDKIANLKKELDNKYNNLNKE